MYSAFKLVPLLSSILVFVASSPKQKGFCWEPGSNPFVGQPKTERLDSDRVRINWSEIFNKNGNCKNVDFLIKSNPRHSPSDYKLSDFTQKGQTSATLMMVTSYFREDTAPDIGFKEVLTTEKLRVTKIKKSSLMTTTTPKYSRNAAKDKCVLPLKKFNSNNILSNKLLKEFIGYMNKNSVRYVHEFMRDKKACSEQSPLGGNCYIEFAECDGSCIPQDWISDNWPDCLDGSDEPELESLSGRSLSEELQTDTREGRIQ
ncbi:LRP2 [Lepeophtheirus salmonis]|uniref:LRP2 n=1 Tax=Lepeophtheirus salmonis TaxID=72036 RepID=A0A7R8HCZ6_LEPSM|nr:LRP2 [Lepeophtheirus salmonis]CAF3000874.1 LRP2 [Lepeophtheirus salmonis]